MRNTILITITAILLFSGCKKNDTDLDNLNTFCSNTKFQVIVSDSLLPISLTEDDISNIIVLGTKGGQTALMKLNPAGAILWNKTFPAIPGTPSEIITLSDNSIVVSSSGPNIMVPMSNLPQFHNVWIQNSIQDPLNCKPTYSLDSVDGYTIKSETYLTRIDEQGNIHWTKQYDECLGKGHSIIRNSVGCISMATMKLKGRVPIPVFNQDSVFQDTVNYPEDDNTVCFYIIGKDGNTLLRKEIDKVFNKGYSEISSPIDIQQMSSNYVIKTEKNTMIVSDAGTFKSNYTNHEEHCNNKNNSMCANRSTILVSSLYITLDMASYLYNYNHYIQRLSNTMSIMWEIESSDALKDVFSDRFLTISKDSSTVNMYSTAGSKLWSLSKSGSGAVKINCIKGATMAITGSGQLTITRTNSSGEY